MCKMVVLSFYECFEGSGVVLRLLVGLSCW